ncbi:MAG: aminoacyl-tRNA deacylase [Deltaproteobacteria bacterium]|nr:aminoacyl-tRNA deacylase [Deltaproteobacteria bacterium]
MSVTSAQRFLKERGIRYEAREYDHKIKGAEFAAEALGWGLDAMIKTLVVALSDGSFCLCLMPGHQELSLKALAREAGAKSARMAAPEEAEKLTGYRVGGISPFGTRRPLPAWMEESLLRCDTVGINGGRRGLIVFLPPGQVQEVLGARAARLATGD